MPPKKLFNGCWNIKVKIVEPVHCFFDSTIVFLFTSTVNFIVGAKKLKINTTSFC